jgi:CheY-like chemotaxis protein
LDSKIEQWKGDREQLDDILVMGFKVPDKLKKRQPATIKDWTNKNILIAEDTDINYFLLVEALRGTGVNVERAVDGQYAVDQARETDFDLLLMDLNMPVKDGYEATKEIKSLKPSLPVIIQTAMYGEEEADKSKKIGADDYISKPIDLKEFINILSKYLD